MKVWLDFKTIKFYLINQPPIYRDNQAIYWVKHAHLVEQRAFKNVNNCLNTNIYSYLETSCGQNSNLYLNIVHFFDTSVK